VPRSTKKKPHTLIIGGTRGTGRALVRLFASKGHLISVIGRHQPAATKASPERVHYWKTDILNQSQLEKTLAEIVRKNGKLNCLVFCQRYRGQEDPWSGDLQVSLTATKTAIEQLSDSFADNGDKAIVIVGSIAGQFVAEEQPVSYHVAKAGLAQMVRFFAVALGAKGIRVNGVSPSSILKEESKHFYLEHQELLELYRRIVPLGRMGTAEEIAGVIEFLCSSKASLITGQNIVVDGGLSLQGQESLARKVARLTDLPITQQSQKKQK
jgi:NAD(P)-dependent dehydrogenase (short-subunit alcohol dehydrogenase family)